MFFCPVYLSYINLIIRPFKEPSREEGKPFWSLQGKKGELPMTGQRV